MLLQRSQRSLPACPRFPEGNKRASFQRLPSGFSEARSNLESQVEDQTIALGRELRSGEVSAILKRRATR